MAVAEVGFVEYGEVFTRRWVVETILDLVGYTADRNLAATTLVEPSVGSGAFIGPVVERLAASATAHGVRFEDLADAVRGYDLRPQHVESCQALVAEILRTHGASDGVARWLAMTWLRSADFLLDDADTPADFVVGNPPYIRSDDLDDETEAAYRARWTTMWGRADIFVGFYERALAMLKPDGKLGYICADRWMRNAYGARLRELVAERYAVEALWQMHDVDAFHAEVSAYPAITILARHEQGTVAVLDTTDEFGPRGAAEALNFSKSGADDAHGHGWTGSRLADWFEGRDLWPAGRPALIRVLERLNETFPTLEETGGTTKISIGVASGADKAFIVDAHADVEADRLLPLVMADDIRAGTLGTARRLLINPWDERGELVDLTAYPRMARTLAAHPAVKRRFVARKNPGRWHRTIDKVYPGLAERPKLLLQDMKAQITPVLEPGGLYPHHNLYYIVSTGWDLEVLGGLLLSEVAEAFVDAYGVKMRGGTLRFQAQYLRKIRVPRPEAIPPEIATQLRKAFRARDRAAATRAAEAAYGLPEGTMAAVRGVGPGRSPSLFG
ncbi:Eco57I restriction-modification methylase domain-containing protein [Xylanimonas ulmi]|uniref:site-specific DNA-methyltransferase (adenine-specific) n=1 Tax=Xylanimonas ulmi TaxID=228973 RepID=A0A4Q7M5V4_9MICO|nr:Eco57I restriction-modification methylase domain-containing protein [Xylanibacterium ulmi]RZS62851.1 Eco57I restriction-modification methylase [Xylanibacterium ulmi]